MSTKIKSDRLEKSANHAFLTGSKKVRTVLFSHRKQLCEQFRILYQNQLKKSIFVFANLFNIFPISSIHHDAKGKIKCIKSFSDKFNNDNNPYINSLKNSHLQNACENWLVFEYLFEFLKNIKYNEIEYAITINSSDKVLDIYPIILPPKCFTIPISHIHTLIIKLQVSENILIEKRVLRLLCKPNSEPKGSVLQYIGWINKKTVKKLPSRRLDFSDTPKSIKNIAIEIGF